MAQDGRPLPRLDEPDTGPFWAATAGHELRYQQCLDCHTVVFYPRRHCTGCLSSRLEWKVSAGRGTLYTFSVIRQSYHPFFRAQLPYAVAWVDLDEGPRMLSNVVCDGDPGAALRIDQRLAVEWEQHEGLCIPLFRPVD